MRLLNELDSFNVDEVLISTNGTIPLGKDVFNALKKIKNPTFFVNISDYKCVRDKQQKFYEKLISEGIKAQYYQFMNNDGMWTSRGGIDCDRIESDELVQANYDKCESKACLSLVDGRIYRCGRAAISESLFNIVYTEGHDYFDLRKANSSDCCIKGISDFINNTKFKEYCRFCEGTGKSIPPAIQL